jgi:hypothetical protein
MKNIRWLLCILSLIMFVTPAYALTSRIGDIATVAPDEVLDDDIILVAQNVKVEGTVVGDVFAFGETVTITGDIGGSVFTGGANISIDAKSVEAIWAAGGNIEVKGSVTRNVVLAGGSVCVCGEARIGKDLGAYAGKFTTEGDVAGTIRGSVGKFVMAGKGGRVKIKADDIMVKANAEIAGDLMMTSENEPVIEEGATILGETTFEKPEAKEGAEFLVAIAPMIAFFLTVVRIVLFIAKVIVGVLLIALFGQCVRRVMDTLITKPWKSLGVGFLGLIVIPIASVIMFVIVIGYPIGVVGMYTYSILLYTASIFVGLVVGEKVIQLFKKEGAISLYLSFIVGYVILRILGLIPILGFIIRIFVLLFGAGALLLAGWHLMKEMKAKKLI